jgi:hypothetical protein
MVLANDQIRSDQIRSDLVWFGLERCWVRRLGAWGLYRGAVNRSAIAVAHICDKLQRIGLAFRRAIISLHQ